jgi:hypothetical protein
MCSLAGYSFAAEQAEPAAEQPKVEEKAPAAEETKAKEEKKEIQQEVQKTEAEQQAEQVSANKQTILLEEILQKKAPKSQCLFLQTNFQRKLKSYKFILRAFPLSPSYLFP